MQILKDENLILSFDDVTKDDLSFLVSRLQTITSKFYIVGGTVRDFMLNRKYSRDIDIEVYIENVEEFEKLMLDIGACGVGKSFFVYKWKNFDISLPRTETKTSRGYTGFSVELANDEKIASKRRDFTINALMYDIQKSQIIDFWGAIEDLKSKKLKVVSQNSFVEDSLRVMRGVRFSSELGFKLDIQTFDLMNGIDLSDLNKERVANELLKICEAQYPHLGLYYMYKLSIFQKLFGLEFRFIHLLHIAKIVTFTKKNKQNIKQEFLILYLLKHFLKIESLNRLHIFSIYAKTIDNERDLDFHISDYELLDIACNKQINNFMGCINNQIISKAKKYDIYDKKLELPFSTKIIYDEGFRKIEIKNEFNRRKIKFIFDKIEDNL